MLPTTLTSAHAHRLATDPSAPLSAPGRFNLLAASFAADLTTSPLTLLVDGQTVTVGAASHTTGTLTTATTLETT